MADHVDKHLMRRHGLSKDGDLFKAVHAQADFSGNMTLPWGEVYEKKEGLTQSFAPIQELTTFVSTANDATFSAEWATRLNARDYEDWWIFNSLILGTDSAGKNAYHYRDPATSGPWRYIPWDLDASFGQNFDTTRTSATLRHTFTAQNRLFARMLADSDIARPLRERYRSALRNELGLEGVMALIDRYEAEIGPAARRDWNVWDDTYLTFGRDEPGSWGVGNFPNWGTRTDYTSHDEKRAYLRTWIRTRWTSFLADGVP